MATRKSTAVETTALNSVEATEEKPIEAGIEVEASYSKEQITASKKYLKYIDVLNTILGNRKYTFSEVDQLLKEFLESEV